MHARGSLQDPSKPLDESWCVCGCLCDCQHRHQCSSVLSTSWKVSNKHYPSVLIIISCPALEMSLDRNMAMTSATRGKTPSAGDDAVIKELFRLVQPSSTSFHLDKSLEGWGPSSHGLPQSSGMYLASPLATAH